MIGAHEGIGIDEYHAMPGVSNSGLSDFARSPAHYYALHLDPARPPEVARSGQLEGNLAHCAILEPDHFDDRYALGPVNDKRLKAWRDWQIEVEDRGVEKITPREYTTAFAQAVSVRKIKDVATLLAKGRPEVSCGWIDAATGELCRCRPDWVHPVGNGAAAGVILLDVKTCGDACAAEFTRQIARKGYHRQAAFYSDGYALATGEPVLGFIFVAVESSWPYAAGAYMLDEVSIDKGREEIAELLPRFAACRAANSWPGYSDTVELISLPEWRLAA